MQLTDEEAVRATALETQLSVRQAMILMSLAAGTYYKMARGATIADLMRGEDTEEHEMIDLDLIEHNVKLLELTPWGRTAAAWFVQVLGEVMREDATPR